MGPPRRSVLIHTTPTDLRNRQESGMMPEIVGAGGIQMAIKVGFIGVGNMGNPMAANVLKAGFPMTVFDLNPKAMENLVKGGATAAASAAEVVEKSDVVFTSLPAPPGGEKAYLEPGGLIERAKPGTVL